MEPRPYYILFAGVNGAGKSTLFQSDLWQHGGFNVTIPRVNPDEIIVANGWDWRRESDQIKAGRLAINSIRQHLERRDSFNQETTLTGKTIMRTLRHAHEIGYRIIVFYVCVSEPELANTRIARRGTAGGHLINPKTVARRYETSIANLVEIADICDELYLYDNTVSLELEARFESGELAFFNPAEPHLAWIARIMNALGYADVDF